LSKENSIQQHHYYLHHHHHYYQLQQQQQQYLHQQQLLKQQQSLSSAKLLKSKSKNKLKLRPQTTPTTATSIYSNLKLKNNSYDDSSSCCNPTTCSDTTTSSLDNNHHHHHHHQYSPLGNANGLVKASTSAESSSSTQSNHAYNGLKSKSKPPTKKNARLNQQAGNSSDSANAQIMEELETTLNHSLSEYEQACRLINFDSNIDMIVSLIDMSQYPPMLLPGGEQEYEGEAGAFESSLYNVSSISDYENNNNASSTRKAEPKSNSNAVLTLNSLNSFIQTINIPKYVCSIVCFCMKFDKKKRNCPDLKFSSLFASNY
jgi:hypothetical protein